MYYGLACSSDIDKSSEQSKLDIAETVRRLGYRPTYSLRSLLRELAATPALHANSDIREKHQ
jgi:hypothetical protein